jgi:hypothetical protein
MNELPLLTELVGGLHDGCIWWSGWVPHWCQRITWGARKPNGSILWAEYDLKEIRFARHDRELCIHLCYAFAGFRRWFPARFSWLFTMLARWRQR